MQALCLPGQQSFTSVTTTVVWKQHHEQFLSLNAENKMLEWPAKK
jgi:hypothetical protein